jgi:cell division protein FtsQ
LKKVKQIAFITLWVVLVTGLMLSLGFVNKTQDSLLCKTLDIKVNQDDDLYFLDKIDVQQLIRDRGDSIIGQPKSTVNIPELENSLNSHAAIANAEVYITVNGEVKVEVKQRKPVIRIINAGGESYYLDSEGTLMPLSDKYTAKVIVANGVISEPYAKRYMYSIEQIGKDSSERINSLLDELYAMANYINANEFWTAQVQQIYINADKDMELVPMVGDQRIIFGDTTAMEEKFKKLLVFYQQGLNTTGWWDKYSTINLKFKNQIVCTKKEVVPTKQN